MSEFFAEEEGKRVDAKSLTQADMEIVKRVMLSFPKDKLTEEDSKPILMAGRRVLFTSTLTGVAALMAARAIRNLPKQVPVFAGLVSFLLASRITGESQRVNMWDEIINSNTDRGSAIRGTLSRGSISQADTVP